MGEREEERKRAGVADWINNLRRKRASSRTIISFVRAAPRLMAPTISWVPLAIGLGALFFLSFFIILFANQQNQTSSSNNGGFLGKTGNARKDIKRQFNIEFDEYFDNNVLVWAEKALIKAKTNAPLFFALLGPSPVKIKASDKIGHTIGRDVFFKKDGGPLRDTSGNFFSIAFIHELAHIMYSGSYELQAEIESAIKTEGYLTSYAENSTSNPEEVCSKDEKSEGVRINEDFAESVTYYINSDLPETSYDVLFCPPVKNPGENPIWSNKYPLHLKTTRQILGEKQVDR